MSWKKPILGLGIGALAGFTGSLVGMGGGFVSIPFLTGAMGLSQHQAHGTSLVAVMTTGIAGCISYSKGKAVDLPIALIMASTGIIFANLGAKATKFISGNKLKLMLGTFMILVSPIPSVKGYFIEKYKHNNNENEEKKEIKYIDNIINTNFKNNSFFNKILSTSLINECNTLEILKIAGVGCFSGIVAGIFGIGGGAITVPALTLITSLDHYGALGTSLAAMILPAVIGVGTHFVQKNVILSIGVPLAAGTFLGAYIGGKCGLNIPEQYLRIFFTLLLLTLGIRTFSQSRNLLLKSANKK